jgi:hypothetical protein
MPFYMELKIFDILNQKLNERVLDISRSLSDGVAKDYADYRGMCGVIKGLRTAQFELNDLLRKIKDDDDE